MCSRLWHVAARKSKTMLPLPSTFKDRQKDTRHGYCRVCHAEWNRQHYLRNKAAYVATARRTNPKYVGENTRCAVEFLLAHPCIDCVASLTRWSSNLTRSEHNGRAQSYVGSDSVGDCQMWRALCQLPPPPDGAAVRFSQVDHSGSESGRGGRARTRDFRFWRSALFQLSYAPELCDCLRLIPLVAPCNQWRPLLRLSMLRVLAAARAELLERQPIRIVPLVLLGVIGALATVGAGEGDEDAVCLLGHAGGCLPSNVK
jgi:hypothetical protein